MIIPFKETPETRKGYPCTAFRWTFQLDWGFVGLVHQYQIENKWYDSHVMVYSVDISKDWKWGFDHFWYDGPHCFFSLGPIHFQWWSDSCKKCNVK